MPPVRAKSAARIAARRMRQPILTNAWTLSGYLFALSIVLSTGGCSNIVKPVRPPEGMALLKANALKPKARDLSVGDLATCYKSIGGHSASVCNLNGTQRPEAIVKPTTGFASAGWTREVLPSGTMVVWGTAYPLQPGHQRLIVENDQEYCGDESRWRRWVAAGVVGGLTGAVGITMTAIAESRGQQPALMIEFDADAGKSYLLECDINHTPWAWVAPEDQR